MKETRKIDGSLKFTLQQQTLWLLPQKALYWQEQQILMLSDLHLGKAGHFRKSGIPIPAAIHHEDLSVLHELILFFQPLQVLILGDLFHSAYNEEWKDFEQLLNQHSNTPFALVKGNHDILPDEAYQHNTLTVWEHSLLIPPFYFTHKPAFAIPSLPQAKEFTEVEANLQAYNLAGHIHPGVRISDKTGHPMKMPCFYFGPHGGLLPAFGKFTGYKCLPKTSRHLFFGIAELSASRSAVFRVA